VWARTGDRLSGILQTVVTERRTLRGDNPGGDPASMQLPVLHPDVHAFLVAPIGSPVRVYGWICLVGNEGRCFTAEDEDLLVALSGQIGRIYENVYLCAITERRAEDLQRLSERLSLAIAVAMVGVWEWDLAANAMTWDETMCRIYGAEPVAQVPYEQWLAVVHPEDRLTIEATLQQAIVDKKGSAEPVEFRIVLANGSVRTLSAAAAAVLDGQANVTRLVGVNMDITARKEAEATAEFRRNEQMRFKDEFLSHVSHELRTPLTAVKQFTSILLSGYAGDLNAQQHEYQQIVLKNISQLQSMIGDILEVSRLETGKLTVTLESISVAAAVVDTNDTFQLTARAAGIALSCDLPPDLPAVRADKTRIRQMLTILVDNAIKFSSPGGTVSVTAKLSSDNPRFLLFEVADTGCGLSPDIGERIFDRLYQAPESTQASRKGLGLGLYICRELVLRQGGQIWARRGPVKGSIFSFTLPVSSLHHVIAPFFQNSRWPATSAALVMIEASPKDSWTSAVRDDWSKEVHDLVQDALPANHAIVLPTMRVDPETERLLVLAFCDSKAALTLTRRIRKRSQRIPGLDRSKHSLSVSYRMLEQLDTNDGVSLEDNVSSMASNIEAAINMAVGCEGVT
jgi:PAS domain S-box-containing protein